MTIKTKTIQVGDIQPETQKKDVKTIDINMLIIYYAHYFATRMIC